MLTRVKKNSNKVLKKPKQYHEFGERSLYNSLRSLKDPRLQAEVKKWYAKLEQSGFEDIEKNPSVASGKYPTISGFYSLDSTHNYSLSFDSAKSEVKGNARYELYQMVSTFAAWMPPALSLLEIRKRRILEMYSEGWGAKRISAQIKYELGVAGNSVWTIHYDVKNWMPEIVAWNKENENGLFCSSK